MSFSLFSFLVLLSLHHMYKRGLPYSRWQSLHYYTSNLWFQENPPTLYTPGAWSPTHVLLLSFDKRNQFLAPSSCKYIPLSLLLAFWCLFRTSILNRCILASLCIIFNEGSVSCSDAVSKDCILHCISMVYVSHPPISSVFNELWESQTKLTLITLLLVRNTWCGYITSSPCSGLWIDYRTLISCQSMYNLVNILYFHLLCVCAFLAQGLIQTPCRRTRGTQDLLAATQQQDQRAAGAKHPEANVSLLCLKMLIRKQSKHQSWEMTIGAKGHNLCYCPYCLGW